MSTLNLALCMQITLYYMPHAYKWRLSTDGPVQDTNKNSSVGSAINSFIEADIFACKHSHCVRKPANLLQNLPDFLIKAHWHSVEGSIQPPPANPLALAAIQRNRKTHRAIKRLEWTETLPLAVTWENMNLSNTGIPTFIKLVMFR